MQLVLATRNKDKTREIKELLIDLPITVLTFENFLEFPEVEETGSTLAENAILKAKTIAKFTGYPAIADDTGLEVDALNGAPGVYSSRYAGENCSYDDNNRKLLKALEGVPKDKRAARFRTVIAIAWSPEEIETVEGVVNGLITENKMGQDGFGYDPVFYFPPAGKTFAEMSLEEKNRVSHRGQALRKAREVLKKKLKMQY